MIRWTHTFISRSGARKKGAKNGGIILCGDSAGKDVLPTKP